MNRDNVLFLVIGALAGFIGGYVMQETMASYQPPPRRAGAAPPPAAQGAPAGAPAAPASQEVQRLLDRLAENPDDTEAIRRLANLNYDISNWQRAAELYERYLELDPSNPDVMTDLGATYRFLGRPEDALEQFRRVREGAPDHWQSRYNEILVLALDLGDFEAAGSAMAELQRLEPDNEQVSRLAAELERRARGSGP